MLPGMFPIPVQQAAAVANITNYLYRGKAALGGTGMAIGSDVSTRWLVIATAYGNNGVGSGATSLTVNGVAFTKISETPNTSNNYCVCFWKGQVAGTVISSFSLVQSGGVGSGNQYAVYTMDVQTSITLVDNKNSTGNGAVSSHSFSLTTTAAIVCLGVGIQYQNRAISSFTNLTLDGYTFSTNSTEFGSTTTIGGNPLTVGATFSAAATVSLVKFISIK